MKLRMKMLFSLAFAMVFIASAVGFSVFAGGPYTEETLPGFQEVTNEVSFNDTTYSVTRKKVVFEYHVFSYLGFCSNESEEIWTQDVEDDGVPSDILNNGYSFYFMKEMFITPDYYLEGSQSGDVTYKIFRGWAFCDENRNLISEPSEEIRFTEEDFGCYITPVYTKSSGTTEEDPSSTTTTTTAATTDEVTTTTTDTNAPTDSADTTMDNTNDKSNSPDTGEGSLAPVLVIFILSIVFAAGAVGFGLLRKGVRADSLEKE